MGIITRLKDSGLESTSPTDVIGNAIRSLTRDEIVELAIWSVRYQLARMEREAVRSAERTASLPAAHVEARVWSDQAGQEWPDEEWMRKSPKRFTKGDAEVWDSLPEEHPAKRYRAEIYESEARINRRMMGKVAASIEALKKDLKVQWTSDLLAQRITMPDGTSTTWGDASVAQHRERLEMFKANAVANIEGAARHQQAIEDLEAVGAACLANLQEKAVA